ncbi:MAG: FlgD immunoglobulin-like domain containing protein, partial [bacterium]
MDSFVEVKATNPSGLNVKLSVDSTETDSTALVPNDDSFGSPDFYVAVRMDSPTEWKGNAVDRNSGTNDAFSYRVNEGGIVYSEDENAPSGSTEFASDKSLNQDVGDRTTITADTREPNIEDFTFYKTSDFNDTRTTKYSDDDNLFIETTFDEPNATDNVTSYAVDFNDFDTFGWSGGVSTDKFRTENGDTIIINPQGDRTFRVHYIASDSNGYDSPNVNLKFRTGDDVDNTGVQRTVVELDNNPPTWVNTRYTNSDTVYVNGDTINAIVKYKTSGDTGNVDVIPDFSKFDSEYTDGDAEVSDPFNVGNGSETVSVSYTISTANTFDSAKDTPAYVFNDNANTSANIDATPSDTRTIVLDNIAPGLDAVSVLNTNNQIGVSGFDGYFKRKDQITLEINPNEVPISDRIDSPATRVDYTNIDDTNDTGSFEKINNENFKQVHTISSPKDDGESVAIPFTLVDLEGNERLFSDTALATLDTTEPNASIDKPDTGDLFVDTPINIVGNSSDPDGNDNLTDVQNSGIQFVQVTVEADTDGTHRTILVDESATDASSGEQESFAEWTFQLDDAIDTSGDYFVSVQAADRAGNLFGYGDTKVYKVRLDESDTKEVQISNLSASPNPFSPDGNGQNDKTTLSYSLNRSADTATVKIFTPSDSRIRTITDTQNLTSGVNSFTWDGFDEKGNFFGEGEYRYKIKVEAGNASSDQASNFVTIDITPPQLSITKSGPDPISPNGDFVNEFHDMELDVNNAQILTVSVINPDGERVTSTLWNDGTEDISGDYIGRTLDGSDTTLYYASGKNDDQSFLTQRSQEIFGDKGGFLLNASSEMANGEWIAEFIAEDDADNKKTLRHKFVVDKSRLEIDNLSITNDPFSPENQDFNFDQSFISFDINKDALVSVKIQDPDNGNTIKTIVDDTSARPADNYTFEWDGTNDNGNFVSDDNYDLRVRVENPDNGNVDTRKDDIEVDNTPPDQPRITEANRKTTSDQVDITGITEPGASVQIYVNDQAVGEPVDADQSTGQFSVSGISIEQGFNIIRADASDAVENTSNPSGSKATFNSGTPAPDQGTFDDTSFLDLPRESEASLFVSTPPDTATTVYQVVGALNGSEVADTFIVEGDATKNSFVDGEFSQDFDTFSRIVRVTHPQADGDGDGDAEVVLRASPEFVHITRDNQAPLSEFLRTEDHS